MSCIMNNSNFANISLLNSDNLKDEINSFKNKFVNKSQYFICEQDIVGLTMNKYLDIIENFILSNLKKFKNNFVIKIYKLIKKIKSVGAKIDGIILNDVDTSKGSYGYYNYYQNYYGTYQKT